MRRFTLSALFLAALVLGLHAGASAKEPPRPWMLVLGKTQLLHGAKAYPGYCVDNESKSRQELRTSAMAKLKAIAERERAKLLAAVGDPKDARALWLLNAVVVRLSAEEAVEFR